jgi:hypothetical protein
VDRGAERRCNDQSDRSAASVESEEWRNVATNERSAASRREWRERKRRPAPGRLVLWGPTRCLACGRLARNWPGCVAAGAGTGVRAGVAGACSNAEGLGQAVGREGRTRCTSRRAGCAGGDAGAVRPGRVGRAAAASLGSWRRQEPATLRVCGVWPWGGRSVRAVGVVLPAAGMVAKRPKGAARRAAAQRSGGQPGPKGPLKVQLIEAYSSVLGDVANGYLNLCYV